MKLNLLKMIGAGLVLSVFAGCIVMSVYPFYTAIDLIYDPGLAGCWNKDGKTNEFWQFSQAGEKSYFIAAVDPQDTNCFEAHLFQLEQFQFLDLLTTNRVQFQLPAHLIARVNHSGTNLSLQFLDYNWLSELLATNPAALHHIVVPENAEQTNNGNMLYLTAGTSELQAFLRRHATDTNAFNLNSAVELNSPAQNGAR